MWEDTKDSAEDPRLSDPLKVLDFTEAEEAVLNALLEKGPQSVSGVGRVADVARTTAFSVLKRLEERGLVRRKSRGYASIWGVVSPHRLRKRITASLSRLDREVTPQELEAELGVKISKSTEFFVFRGVEATLRVYQWFMINHRNERVYGIQPMRSMESIFKKLDVENVAQLNDLVKDNRIIMDAILPESIRQYYPVLLSGRERLATSIEGRTTSVHLIPDALISFSADLVIARDSGFLVNWDDEMLIYIKNREMMALLLCLFESLRDQGKLFDHNAFVRSIIAGRN